MDILESIAVFFGGKTNEEVARSHGKVYKPERYIQTVKMTNESISVSSLHTNPEDYTTWYRDEEKTLFVLSDGSYFSYDMAYPLRSYKSTDPDDCHIKHAHSYYINLRDGAIIGVVQGYDGYKTDEKINIYVINSKSSEPSKYWGTYIDEYIPNKLLEIHNKDRKKAALALKKIVRELEAKYHIHIYFDSISHEPSIYY